MPTACTQFWVALVQLWTQPVLWQDFVAIPWQQCTAQRQCYWWCLCCNKWLCWIALIIVAILVVTFLILWTFMLLAIIGTCETVCVISRIGRTDGNCFVTSFPPSTPPPPPLPPLTISAGGPYSGEVAQPLAMKATLSNPSVSSSVTVGWDFGDGGKGSGLAVSHTYNEVNGFAVTVTATGPTTAGLAVVASDKTTADIIFTASSSGPTPL